METCPLCSTPDAPLFFKDDARGGREFFSCDGCGLVFVSPRFFPTPEEEKRRYDLHRNDPSDAGYRRHLSRMVRALAEHVPPGSRGLDFGSGPGPALRDLLVLAGYPTEVYDPFYAPDPSVLGECFRFVTATEVAEHLRDPASTFRRIWSLVLPGGCLGLMTQSPPSARDFKMWSYKNDITHLCFFRKESFEYLARQWSARVLFPEPDVILMIKPADHGGSIMKP